MRKIAVDRVSMMVRLSTVDREHRTLSNMIEHWLIDFRARHAITSPVANDEQLDTLPGQSGRSL